MSHIQVNFCNFRAGLKMNNSHSNHARPIIGCSDSEVMDVTDTLPLFVLVPNLWKNGTHIPKHMYVGIGWRILELIAHLNGD